MGYFLMLLLFGGGSCLFAGETDLPAEVGARERRAFPLTPNSTGEKIFNRVNEMGLVGSGPNQMDESYVLEMCGLISDDPALPKTPETSHSASPKAPKRLCDVATQSTDASTAQLCIIRAPCKHEEPVGNFLLSRDVLMRSLAFFSLVTVFKMLVGVHRRYAAARLALRDIAGDVYAYLQKHTGTVNLIDTEKQLTLLSIGLSSEHDRAVGCALLTRYKAAHQKRAYWRRIKRVANGLQTLSGLIAAASFYRRWHNLPKRRQFGR